MLKPATRFWSTPMTAASGSALPRLPSAARRTSAPRCEKPASTRWNWPPTTISPTRFCVSPICANGEANSPRADRCRHTWFRHDVSVAADVVAVARHTGDGHRLLPIAAPEEKTCAPLRESHHGAGSHGRRASVPAPYPARDLPPGADLDDSRRRETRGRRHAALPVRDGDPRHRCFGQHEGEDHRLV